MKIKLPSNITRKSKNKKKENKKPELSNSEIFYLIRFSSYLTRFFYFHFFILKFLSYEKLALTSQFDLTWEFQIPKLYCNKCIHTVLNKI